MNSASMIGNKNGLHKILEIVDELVDLSGYINPYTICEYLGILVIVTELPKRIRGFYQSYEEYQIIYINDRLVEEEQRIVCAHELGHAVLHSDMNIVFLGQNTRCVTSKYEMEADVFCSYLILKQYEEQELECLSLEQIGLFTGLGERLVRLYERN